MQLLIEYIPIVFFVFAYFYEDLYFATGVLMAVMPIGLIVLWSMTKKLPKIYAASTALVLIAGTATLILRNPIFLFWKPTVLNWAIALVFLGSQWIGEKSMVRRMLEKSAELTPAQWARLNFIWVGFFIFIGAVNIYVAYEFGEEIWVKFKIPGMLGLTFVFVIVQSIWLTSQIQKNAPTEDSES